MADPTKALETAIYTTLSGDATLSGKVAGVYNTLAPEDAAYPLVVFQQVAVTPHNALGARNYWQYLYQFRVIDEGLSKAMILDALARIDALLERQPLTVTGATVLAILRDSDLPDMATVEGGTVYQQVGAQWRFWVQET